MSPTAHPPAARAEALSRAGAPVAIGAWLVAVAAFATPPRATTDAWPLLSLAGADGSPSAMAFNALAFVLPGLVAALLAWRARSAAPHAAGWATRLGWQCVLLSALAFAAQGLLPLDPDDLDAAMSRRHAVAWTLWWIAFVPGTLLLALGALAATPRRAAAAGLHLAAALALALLAWAVQGPAGQWLATVAWLAWLPLAAVAGQRASPPR